MRPHPHHCTIPPLPLVSSQCWYNTPVYNIPVLTPLSFPQASNVATYIAHGNVALSVLMTTASTLGAIIMTPLLTKVLAGAYVPVDAYVCAEKGGDWGEKGGVWVGVVYMV